MTPAGNIYLDFVGCRLNEAEIEALARQYTAQGYRIVNSPHEAATIVLNTCAVTNDATRKSRQSIFQAGRANPKAQIIATGCYAEFDQVVVSAMPGVSHVIPNQDKDNLVKLTGGIRLPSFESEPITREPLPPGTLGRNRAFVKVQDGCDNHCTFCITTVLRGSSMSRPTADIVQEIHSLVETGYHEVVLTGVHLGSYGQDLDPRPRLADLVAAILNDTDIDRLRLSSLEPWDIDEYFFDLWSNSRLCPHFHLPLQSGSDSVLKRMARRTTRTSFSELVTAARRRIPDLTLTGDIIVGFPGETEGGFAETLEYIGAIDFARLHVFTYSPRPGTAAARMSGQIPGPVKHERYNRASELSKTLWDSWQQRNVGRHFDVLWESAHGASPEGFEWSGLTGNYLRVFTQSADPLYNSITPVVIDKFEHGRLTASPLISQPQTKP